MSVSGQNGDNFQSNGSLIQQRDDPGPERVRAALSGRGLDDVDAGDKHLLICAPLAAPVLCFHPPLRRESMRLATDLSFPFLSRSPSSTAALQPRQEVQQQHPNRLPVASQQPPVVSPAPTPQNPERRGGSLRVPAWRPGPAQVHARGTNAWAHRLLRARPVLD